LIIVAVYFLMIRPQSKKRREATTMQSSLGPGDEIVTIGGLYGTVTDVDDETVTLEISPGVTARYARQAVGRVLTSNAAEEETPQVDDSAAEKTVDHG
jgi:preprotein translocase subunit YajC